MNYKTILYLTIILSLLSNTKVLTAQNLPTDYTTAQINSITSASSAAEGDLYHDYQQDIYYLGATDGSLIPLNSASGNSSGGWELDGNTATSSDYLGTNNFASLYFRVNSNQIASFHPLGGIVLGRNAAANNNQGVAIGESADGGQQSAAVGYEAEATGFQSNAFGYGTNAINNSATAIGFNSTASGQQSTVLGYNSSATGQNSTAIGHGANTAQANAVVIGNTTDDTQWGGTKVGLGTSTPSRRLHVDGGFRLEDGTEGTGKILTSDANGNASWQSPQSNSFPQILVDANRTSSYSMNQNYSTVVYNSASTNVGSAYNTGNGIFTAPADGLYQIIYNNQYSYVLYTNNTVFNRILINNSVVEMESANGSWPKSGNAPTAHSTNHGNTIVELKANNTVRIQQRERSSSDNISPETGSGQHRFKIIRLK